MPRLNAALSGRYQIVRPLGEGGMATVYLADDLKHGRQVALKVLKPELAAVVGAERFLAEIRTTAKLQHPHILALHDSGEANGFLYYVMPRVEGESLRERLDREHQLPVDEAVRIASAVAQALGYAHARGVIHRDIKPANILLQSGQPVVSDFGIALAVRTGSASRLTETGLSLGTPHYMSPEQATGEADVGPASDVWALACVLYEMLVGEPPHIGSTPQAVLGKIITGEAPSAAAARRSVQANVDAAIRKALEKLPADRFQSAEEFARALGDPAFAHGEAGAATTVGGLTARAWRRVALGTGALAVAALLVAVWTLTRPGPVARVERFRMPFEPGQEVLAAPGNFTLSPDGSLLVYHDTLAGNGLRIRRWSEMEARTIAGTENAEYPRISWDGSLLAFQQNGGIRVVSLAGGPVSDLGAGTLPVWGPGRTLYAELRGEMVQIPLDGGPATVISERQEGELRRFAQDVLPSGDLALVGVSLSDGPQIHMLDLTSGESTFLVSGASPRWSRSGHVVYRTLDDGLLLAVPVDARRGRVTGPAVTLVDGGRVAFSLADDGKLFYATYSGPGAAAQLVWMTRAGEVQVVDEEWIFERPGGRFFGYNYALTLSPDGRSVAHAQLTEDGGSDIWVKGLDRGPLTPT